MPTVKHKLFKIKILDIEDGWNSDIDGYDFDAKGIEEIDIFLSESNYIYVNHSICVLGKDRERSSNGFRDIILLISLVYKDLNDTPNQLKNVSKQTKEIVRKSIEKGEDFPKPQYKTSFDTHKEK